MIMCHNVIQAVMVFTLLISKCVRMLKCFPISNDAASFVGYNIRRAQKRDIPCISQCNVENLPENYNQQFYTSHLYRWPDLSYIAKTDDGETVGYALGRVELLPADRADGAFRLPNPLPYSKSVYVGHIASIAVNKKFRGMGVAANLMKQLHYTFANNYDLDQSTLYCRPSNTGAIKLYSQSLSYSVAKRIPKYYEEGEDAFYMTLSGLQQLKKPLLSLEADRALPSAISSSMSSSSSSSNRGGESAAGNRLNRGLFSRSTGSGSLGRGSRRAGGGGGSDSGDRQTGEGYINC